MTYKGSEY